MHKTILLTTVVIAALSAGPLMSGGGSGTGDNKPIAGIGPTGPIKKWQTGFKWAEGPIADGKGNVYFSDLQTNKVHKIDADGKLSVFSSDLKGPNGLMFNIKGELVACEMTAGRIVAFDMETKKIRVVADTYQGKGFGGPNDLVTDLHGGVYFTDYRLNKAKQDKMGVYYVDADGKVTRLVDDLKQPNGVILSTDEKTLYVIPSGQPEVMSYPVESPGKIGKGKVFCKMLPMPGKKGGPVGDGVAIDTKGNLYFAVDTGIQVFDPKGEHLGTIIFPEPPANVDFGGADFKTMIVTSRTSVYTVPMEAVGHQFGKASAAAPLAVGQAKLDHKEHATAAGTNARFEQFKKLAGEWMGTEKNKEGFQVHVKYQVTAGGTAVVETLFPGTGHEMVTVIHPDGDDLLLTHYCMLGNQPQMKASGKGDTNKVEFKFVRATNLKSEKDMHMHEATFTFVNTDTLKTEWTNYIDGKAGERVVFEVKRKKAEK